MVRFNARRCITITITITSYSQSSSNVTKAIIRCKKAQAVVRAYNVKETIKAGMTVEKKLKEMLDLTKKEDFGELTNELEALNSMITNMQKAVLEPLLESVETIERRMHHYVETLTKSHSMAVDMDDEAALTKSQAEFNYDPKVSSDAKKELEEELTVSEAPDQATEEVAKTPSKSSPTDEDISGDTDMEAVQQRFFERLNRFFELQGIAEDQVAALDPHAKIAGLKLKLHSKGIQEKDGTYKSAYRQQDTTGKPIRHLSDLYMAAGQALPEFKTLLSSLVDAVSGLGDDDWELATIKRRDRAAEKAHDEYSYRQPGPPESWLYDILRASIECKTSKQMAEINKWLKENVHIVDGENHFTVPRYDGYRDIVYYVAVPYNGDLTFICEIQVHHKELRQLFGTNAQRTYFRTYFSGQFRDDMDSLRDLDMLLQLGCIDDQLMEFLLESSDPSQLKLFGRLFYEKLEETGKALELFKRVLTMEESTYGKGNIITWTTYQQLGLTLLKKGDPDGAMLYLREGLGVLETNLGGRHPEVAVAQNDIGEVLCVKGLYDEALAEFKRGLANREDALGDDHLLVSDSRLAIAKVLCAKAEYKDALSECRTALIIQQTSLGDVDEKCAASHALIGDILVEQGEYDLAFKSYEKVLAIREEVLGQEHQRVANALTCLGNIKLKQGLLDDAESFFRRALIMREHILGNAHCDCAISYSNLGAVLKERGDYKGSLTAYRLGLSIRTKALGRLHYQTSVSFYDLGGLFIAEESFDDALNHYKECLAIRRHVFGRTHPTTAQALNAIGRVRSRQGDCAGALADHNKAMNIFERVFGGNHPELANSYQFLGEMFVAENNITKGLESHSRALAIRSLIFGKLHPETIESCLVVGDLLERTGDLPGAELAYRNAVLANDDRLGVNHLETAASRIKYSRVLEKQRDYGHAEVEARKAVTAREEVLGTSDLLTAEAYSVLGSILHQKGTYAEAGSMHEKAFASRQEQLGDDHLLVLSSKAALEAATEAATV
jgi:tetratricopeptide (TPR) repeat protein